jgi:hypothetical protein
MIDWGEVLELLYILLLTSDLNHTDERSRVQSMMIITLIIETPHL